MDNQNRCVCCNDPIPEGRQVCHGCENADHRKQRGRTAPNIFSSQKYKNITVFSPNLSEEYKLGYFKGYVDGTNNFLKELLKEVEE